ncbi:hypothetical protein [Altibacter sp.]|uniref:hypothetical protein n=1 Tax=Altibacter sp. TaxID=2024823 RepID=UPI000C94BD27|nr:hypothetical protein [Altibacter sp.]MAP54963.1 hypothetical protein [Altibacter sp.]
MKKILLVVTLLFSVSAFSQDPFLQKDSDQLEAEADKITEAYNAQLALSSKQELLFKNKVEEFLIRRQKIEMQYNGKEKLDQLVILQQNETAEMGDILTRPQLDRYKKLKPTLQPVAQVKQ